MAQVENFCLPGDLCYEPEEHLWVRLEGEVVRIGMDQLGQEVAGTIVHLRIPLMQKLIKKGENFGFLEAGKFVGPLKMPIDGRITAVNQNVLDRPDLVNRDPYREGWLILVRPENLAANLDELLQGEKTIARWLIKKIHDYRERGVLPEKQT